MVTLSGVLNRKFVWFCLPCSRNSSSSLFTSSSEVKYYIEILLGLREGQETTASSKEDLNYNNVHFNSLTDDQILSLVLYTIEKKYHFSCDGIWARQDGVRVVTQTNWRYCDARVVSNHAMRKSKCQIVS